MSIDNINNSSNVFFDIKKQTLAIKNQIEKQSPDPSYLSTPMYSDQDKDDLTTSSLQPLLAKQIKIPDDSQVKMRKQKDKVAHLKDIEEIPQKRRGSLNDIYSRIQQLVLGKLDISAGKAIKKHKRIFYRTPGKGKLKVFHREDSIGSGSFKKVYLVTQLFSTTSKILAYAKPNKSCEKANVEIQKEFGIGHALYNSYKSCRPAEEKTSIPFLKYYSLVDQPKDHSKQVGMLMEAGDKDLLSVRGLALSEQQKKKITRELIDGVAFMHQKGMFHRDLKPNNILLKHDSQQHYHAKITDFGLSCSIGDLQNGPFVGTVEYLPPEFFDDNIPGDQLDANKFDSWALGVTLYELYMGESPPFFKTITEYKAGKITGKDVIDAMKRFALLFNFFAEDTPDDIKDLITNLMNLSFLDRWIAEQTLEAIDQQIAEESPRARSPMERIQELFNALFNLKIESLFI
ncbi:MAG: protein kinase domain-containing protein [Parachlamydiaceae bacterium]